MDFDESHEEFVKLYAGRRPKRLEQMDRQWRLPQVGVGKIYEDSRIQLQVAMALLYLTVIS
jgi:hypothetical protein